MSKRILLVLGFISLGLGLVGSVLPLLPTTPFLLLSAYLFSKSSDKWYRWLINLPKVGGQIQDWNEHGVISVKSKVFCAISIFGVSIWISLILDVHYVVKIVIPIILISLLVFILTRPSVKNNE